MAALVIEEGRVLLAEHRKEGCRYFLLPGGGVHVGETLTAALERELVEECGLGVEPGPLLFVIDAVAPDGARHVVQVVFAASAASELGALPCAGPDGRLSGCHWTALADLPRIPLRPPMADLVLDAARHRRLGEGWPAARYVGPLWSDEAEPCP